MKKLPLVLAVVYGTISVTGSAQKVPSQPEPIVPGSAPAVEATGSAQRVSGAGLCRVHFGSDGQVDRATMVRSTGSEALDEDALRSARRNWCALPGTSMSVPVRYSAVPLHKSSGTIRYDTPIPAYPVWAERQRLTGTCVLQVLFDAQGNPTFAVVAKSSGNPTLDGFTVRHALAHWKSSGGEDSVLTFPVKYLYREKNAQTLQSTVPGVEAHSL